MRNFVRSVFLSSAVVGVSACAHQKTETATQLKPTSVPSIDTAHIERHNNFIDKFRLFFSHLAACSPGAYLMTQECADRPADHYELCAWRVSSYDDRKCIEPTIKDYNEVFLEAASGPLGVNSYNRISVIAQNCKLQELKIHRIRAIPEGNPPSPQEQEKEHQLPKGSKYKLTLY